MHIISTKDSIARL